MFVCRVTVVCLAFRPSPLGVLCLVIDAGRQAQEIAADPTPDRSMSVGFLDYRRDGVALDELAPRTSSVYPRSQSGGEGGG